MERPRPGPRSICTDSQFGKPILRHPRQFRDDAGDIHGPKQYRIIGFGDIHGSKPYEFIGFGDIQGPKPYEFIGFGDCIGGGDIGGETGSRRTHEH